MIPFTLIIPVFNEQQALPATLERLRLLWREDFARNAEVIVVDDGSRDRTPQVITEMQGDLGPAFRFIRHPRNRGYGASLKTGIRAAANDIIAIVDADGTYPIESLERFVAALDEERAAMIVGARPVRQQPAIRRPAKAFLRRLAEYLTGERIPDLNSGFRVFRQSDAMRLFPLLPNGFSFTTTITMALLTEGEKVVFTPIRYRKRIGNSKIHPLRDPINFLLLICRTTLAFNPLKVFGPVGLLLILIGFALLVLRMLLDNAFGVASTIIFLVGGIQVLALGLLADLINRRGQPPK
ncbi:glycosyltransferase family 2 protein [Candidatus Sumerlaeota bacterium]|nr:glycosyltransferase family 2 protein [Candidatus Sumerlaeota bacterium]